MMRLNGPSIMLSPFNVAGSPSQCYFYHIHTQQLICWRRSSKRNAVVFPASPHSRMTTDLNTGKLYPRCCVFVTRDMVSGPFREATLASDRLTIG
ncbi:hypothetical protein HBI56_103950 [Parastagonospora nodorum]|uniref:Uncharacterized protein n=1 Tax=Phaeosphaeria nodorum (strain SN15 / ATCC MYA-4574 / FGSC 10173) TaxID=321614 RepID=A0A7U2FCA1_PHANO|nr:hypothetical protein HBH56_134960 [Parastagonospora nodorum]QRD02624.1 hypothetical protein JI435_418270 [Parastagonospora nodorum SN15]KAH3927101.1 hypothetical protein HBH54_158330 [Parastagonospora nodorum]KAH3949218.1 hypothetical protein HBH53_090020 [Parastagonospora nodorum]KAH3958901.1 hypothetical protein HBH51_205170 [Parastagonospora nodorum]